ncbi:MULTISPECIES: helix-turn-helix domain-containing protein [Haloferax]|uniref:Helix-turn-helix domain-containing protein n=1 Tax=Haloferax marinum TaxID=2666143 RepID=A0A6A8G546_9EURY|nr:MULTISPECIES: helix-turn-helix domain-containing protein [Haloferax]KAB1196854.1 helix-turn-helix domain-containing protein [Haloferax sp. CBA1150]MRW95867.1 helix-turn-helix domain-containing protein [Haloferax marinum]
MSCIAEFTITSESLPLTNALESAPEMRLDVEQAVATDPERPVLFLWASGGDFEAFESGLDADETVESLELMESLPERRLYRVQISDDASAVVYPNDVEVGSCRLDIAFNAEGIHTRMRFPDREALVRYRERCREMGLEMNVRSIYRGDTESTTGYGLSKKQQELLTLAAETGYFEVPRSVSLSDIAEELDISTQSASERLRRGVATLVSSTVCSDIPSNR